MCIMVTDYAEQILQAVQIVTEKCLNNISYDITEICTIVDISDSKNGHYVVSDGTIKYDAYCESSDYKIDDMVRVSIMNGDYTQKKYIIGLHVTDNNVTPITYISPMDSMLDVSDNIISDEKYKDKIFSIKANGNTKQICLWSINLENSNFTELQNNDIFDTIAIRANFKTLLSDYHIHSGSYGLRLDMYVRPPDSDSGFIVHRAYLNNTHMQGNPYSFLVYSMQEKTFDISNLGAIHTMSLYLYQENDFTYYGDDRQLQVVPVADYDNILVKNLYLSFGSNIENIPDNTLKIYSENVLTFDSKAADISYNTKNINLLWYNKDESNKYIGFTDGIVDRDIEGNIIQYDEIEYMNNTKADARLAAQQGRDIPMDKTGLDLSADIEDAEVIIKSLSTNISKNLYQQLQGFRGRIQEVLNREEDTLKNELDAIDTSLKNVTLLFTANEQGKIKELISKYKTALSLAKKKVIDKDTTITFNAETDLLDPANEIKSINNLMTQIQTFLNNSRDIIIGKYGGFMSIWDNYNNKLQKLINTIHTEAQEFVNILGYYDEQNQYVSNNKLIEAYFGNYQYEEWSNPTYEDQANKYCIYWYRYEPGYFDKADTIMGKDWRRLTKDDGVPKNLGLPQNTIIVDDKEYFAKEFSGTLLTRILDVTFPTEKYIAVLFYNHEMIKSNILEFTNENPVINSEISDQDSALQIQHDVDSNDSYQLYGDNNYLLNIADAYRTRYLKVRYVGQIDEIEALGDCQIFWYVPKNATMIKCEPDDYKDKFYNDLNQEASATDISRDGYICFYRTITKKENKDKDGNIVGYSLEQDHTLFPYRIKDYYLPSSTSNTIYCKIITQDQRELETSITLGFSSYGTSGTDYTLVLFPATSKTAMDNEVISDDLSTQTGLLLNVNLYDYDNNEIPIQNIQTGFNPGEAINPKVTFIGPTFCRDSEEALTNMIQVNDKGVVESCLITKKSNTIDCYNAILKFSTTFTTLGSKEETDADGNVIKKEEKVRTVELSSFYPISYTTGNYYMEGPQSVIYDSFGANPRYYKNPFRLFSNITNDTIKKDEEIEDVTWEIIYYKETGEELIDDDDYNLMKNYMPVIGNDNCLIPCNMYLADNGSLNEKKLYPVVICRDKTENKNILWTQPILLMQNRYSSPMLNSWDGSLQIDEENGTILSTILGAGRKTIENTFEGVLMGDVAGTTDSNMIGLYGYHNGAQTFGLKIDGTMFIGKSGHGRILLNGDNSTIQSSSYAAGSKGMLIDLDDGIIDMRGIVTDKNKNTTPTNSRVHIDITSPYFFIDDESQKRLINIASNNYYLQTSDYTPSEESNGSLTKYGSGMKIDLQNGNIDAYNFRIRGQKSKADSTNTQGSYILLDSNVPEMIFHLRDTKNNYQINMLEISPQLFKLHSKNWNAGDGTTPVTTDYIKIIGDNVKYRKGPGENFDETGDTLEAGSEHEIKGGSVTNADTGIVWFSITAKSPQNTSASKWLPLDNTTEFVEKTATTDQAGMQINVGSGIILMHRNTSESVEINVKQEDCPFQIGKEKSTNKRNFRVGWDGSLHGGSSYAWSITAAGKATFKNLNAQGGTFNNIVVSKAKISGGTISSAAISSGTISSASISKGTITSASISKGTITSASISKGTISEATISDATINTATVSGMTITDSLTFSGKGYAPQSVSLSNIVCWGAGSTKPFLTNGTKLTGSTKLDSNTPKTVNIYDANGTWIGSGTYYYPNYVSDYALSKDYAHWGKYNLSGDFLAIADVVEA